MPETNDQSRKAHSSTQRATTRRDFLQASLAGTAAVSSVATTVAGAQTKQKRPNLVPFLGEGQRADALSVAVIPF
jgi:hypothetical protein